MGVLLLLAACGNGPLDAPQPQSNVAPASAVAGPCDVGPSPLRRLTRHEYDNTVRDLLGDQSHPAQRFPPEEEVLGFRNNAGAQTASPVLVEGYLEAAEAVAERAVQAGGVTALTGCDPRTPLAEESCARAFIKRFGRRAWRRPLTSEEVNALLTLFHAGRDAGDFASGITTVIEGALVSPEFLYRVELGEPVPGESGEARVVDHELAARLSYLLWGSMPDELLLNAADAGELSTPAQVEAQARRMLRDPRAKDTLREFHAQWLGLTRLEALVKDPATYPDFSASVRALLREEADALVDEVVWDGPGDLKSLLTAKHTWMNGPLARFYGVNGVRGTPLRKVERPEGAGLLSQAGLWSVHAHPNQTSPVLRGKFVREQFLCMSVPPPPQGMFTVPDVDPTATTRERFAQHRSNPACAACHAMMDPIGLGLEKLDPTGRHRDTENGLPVDDSGALAGTTLGSFQGAAQMGELLSQAREVHACVPRQWFRFAFGRTERSADRCTLDALRERFVASGLNIRELVVAITQTRPFLYRTTEPSSGAAP